MNNIIKIKKLRLERAWSQEQLAEISSLSVRTIQRIENGSEPSLETLSAIATAFDMKVKDLLLILKEEAPAIEKMPDDQIEYANYKADQRAEFYLSSVLFLLMSLLLAFINIITSPEYYWFVYPVFCFVLSLIVKWLRIFVFSGKIENWKKIKRQRYLQKKNFTIADDNIK